MDIVSPEDASNVEPDSFDSENEIIMAIDMGYKQTIGCSYYTAAEERLYLYAESKFGDDSIIEAFKTNIQPTVILISTKISETIEACLNPMSGDGSLEHETGDRFRIPYKLEARPPQEFNYDSAIVKLLNILPSTRDAPEKDFVVPGNEDNPDDEMIESSFGFSTRRSKLLRLSSIIDVECRTSLGCAGSVLTYIGRRKAIDSNGIPGTGSAFFRVSSMEVFSLDNVMLVKSEALSALQIIQPESNPKSSSQGPAEDAAGSKEGLSVYGLFHQLARTPQGKSLLRQYFLRPTLDIDVINQRLSTISVFLQSTNFVPFQTMVKSLKSIKNMRTTLNNLRKGVNPSSNKPMSSNIWLSLRRFAFHALQIRDAMTDVDGCNAIMLGHKVLHAFDPRGLAQVGEQISSIVDFNASAEMHRTVVNSRVDPELDRMKQTYDGIEDLLNQVSHEIAATIPKNISIELNVIFFPQIGFLIAVPLDPQTGQADYDGGDQEDEGWDLVFSTEARAYFKDNRMRELDESLGDMYAVICDREIEIVHELGQKILGVESMLCQTSDICGELDCLLALAQGAQLYNLSRPRVATDNVIDIIGGRHPLQELTVPSYVANHARLLGFNDNDMYQNKEYALSGSTGIDKSAPGMVIMTGPNYSGKSCYVPADRATIGLTDKILTRITTRETVSRVQSAFVIDLQQVALALRLATHRSLLVIDEFGKGTDSNDGAGLACGLFRYLIAKGDNMPKVLAATHFHEIFEKDFLKESSKVAFGHMEISLNADTDNTEDQVVYLYNFKPGRSCSSFGSHCAAMNGVDKAIIERSEELVLLYAQSGDVVAACAKIAEEEENDLKEAEQLARQLLETDLDDLSSIPDDFGVMGILSPL